MKEVGLNTSGQAQGAQRIVSAKAQRQSEVNSVAPTDSIEANLTRTPDFSMVEEDTEARFDAIKARLRNVVHSGQYPPLATIDALSHLIAGNSDESDRGEN